MKIIIFARHGLRYPFNFREKSVNIYNKDIANWNFDSNKIAHLTDKGASIELAFGKFLNQYLNINDEISMKFIANSTQRTYETAKMLAKGLKPDYNQTIECEDTTFKSENEWFKLVYFDTKYLDENKLFYYDQKANKKGIYDKINALFNLDKECKYNTEKTSVQFKDNGWFDATGPLFYSSSASDILQLKYYLGFNENDIFKSPNFIDDLKLLLLSKDYVIDALWANKQLALDGSKNVYKLIKKELNNDADITAIVGHDINIATILAALNIEVPRHSQPEKYPIGSKLIFYINDDNSFRLEYLFYDYKDIRDFKTNSKPIILELANNARFK